ncbi:MAG TPA: alpha/beta fold hydrolase [Ilumatobacteraceae bacterium]|nr:alpha/beta fold hydrolase [Ilumatobacteraceae bacterium]
MGDTANGDTLRGELNVLASRRTAWHDLVVIFAFSGCVLDAGAFELRRDGSVVVVEPQVFEVLAFLVRHRDRLVSKQELLDEVWGDRFVSESALSSRIKAARRAVGDDGSTQAVIRTVHGRGYRFVADVTERPLDDELPIATTPTGATAPVRYVRNGWINIAYQITGIGPPDIVLVPGFVSHLELDWTEPRHAHFLTRLGGLGRLIRFDKRGTGLSDRPTDQPPDLETRMGDVRAVMDAAGSRRAILFGYSEGGPMAVLFAATYPERTAGLILYGTYSRRIAAEDYPWAATIDERRRYGEQLEREWGWEADMRLMCPSADEAMAHWWGERCRAAASPGAARALIDVNSLLDVRNVLPAVQAPTLVLHRSGDRDARVEEGRYLASRIPDSRFVELPGVDHFVAIDPDQILDPIADFVAMLSDDAATIGFLTTLIAVHSIDGVDRSSLEGLVAEAVGLHGGSPARGSVDALMVSVDGPARAVRCAKDIVARASARGLDVGVGVHTAEVTSAGGLLEGRGVEVAAAIAEIAGRAQVVVSDTVAGLIAGAGVELMELAADASVDPLALHLVR